MHGGDIYRNDVEYDFSVNLNPFGVSERIRERMCKSRPDVYPDPRCERLRGAIASCIGVRPEQVLCGNGASELFLAVAQALRPKCVRMPVPSFAGYSHAAMAVGAKLIPIPFRSVSFGNAAESFIPDETFAGRLTAQNDAAFRGRADDRRTERFTGGDGRLSELLFLANPNNPTGTALAPKLLRGLLEDCRAQGKVVVLDECFIEFLEQPGSAVTWVAEYPNLIVVRAFTKSFAIPGLRLGYLVCGDDALRERIARQLPEWNVSVTAQEAGLAACGEYGRLREMAAYVARERAYLTERLKGLATVEGSALADLRVYPSEVNFLLLHTLFPLYEALLKQKILIRDCSDFAGLGSGYYRIAVKKNAENEALCARLTELVY